MASQALTAVPRGSPRPAKLKLMLEDFPDGRAECHDQIVPRTDAEREA